MSNVLISPTVLSQVSPQERWRIDRAAWDALSEDTWYINQEEEPLNHLGKSLLDRWLKDSENEQRKWWQCRVPLDEGTWCNKEFNRFDRAIIHVRIHLDLKPYPCEGLCKKQKWYAEEPLPWRYSDTVNSTERFRSREYRSAHYQGPDWRTCEWW